MLRLDRSNAKQGADPRAGRRLRISLSWWVSAALFATTLSGELSATPADNRHVQVAQVVGKTARTMSKKSGSRELREGDELMKGDQIETGDRTIVRLAFFDGSVITVGQNSIFKLADMRGDEKTMIRWDMKLDKGAARGVVTERDTQKPKEMRGIKMTIQSPVATMGVRGTKFIYAHEQTVDGRERTEVLTESGDVLFSTDSSFPKDMTVEVGGGHWAFVEKGQKQIEAPKVIETEGELRDILKKHGFILDERAPASWGEQPGKGVTKSVRPENCIERKLGWRQYAGTNEPVGDCY